jgi:hypothetical protein
VETKRAQLKEKQIKKKKRHPLSLVFVIHPPDLYRPTTEKQASGSLNQTDKFQLLSAQVVV